MSQNPSSATLEAEINLGLKKWANPAPSDSDVRTSVPPEFLETLESAKTGTLSGTALAHLIDHTLLKADATRAEIEKLCQEARRHSFASVCVNSAWIPFVAKSLEGSATLPIAVVGFPLGAMESQAKAEEAKRAVALGAREIDMVLPIGALKDRDYSAIDADIRAVVEGAGFVPVKVILETAYLTRNEIIAACVLSKLAGAVFVKTSTGFATPPVGRQSGATAINVSLMRKVVGPGMGVKASDGIRSREDALRMVAAGANRIGTSASVAIIAATNATGNGY